MDTNAIAEKYAKECANKYFSDNRCPAEHNGDCCACFIEDVSLFIQQAIAEATQGMWKDEQVWDLLNAYLEIEDSAEKEFFKGRFDEWLAEYKQQEKK